MELAVVVSAVAPLHAEPRIASPQISQRLAGERVEVSLDNGGSWSAAIGEPRQRCEGIWASSSISTRASKRLAGIW